MLKENQMNFTETETSLRQSHAAEDSGLASKNEMCSEPVKETCDDHTIEKLATKITYKVEMINHETKTAFHQVMNNLQQLTQKN